MKKHFFLFSLLLFGVAVFAQQKDISVYEKKEGNTNIVIARNIGKVPYLVTLNIRATGMDVTPGLKAEAVVQPGFMKEVARLTPQPGVGWTYGYDVSYIQYTGSDNPPKNLEIKDAESSDVKAPSTVSPPADNNLIVVYSKPGCSRCSFIKKGLNDKGIKYKEVDVTTADPMVNEMWKNLRDGGFSGESVTMPVVKVNGKLHYNIKDLNKFISEIQI